MRKSTLAAAGLGLAACFAGTGASAQSRVEVGVLNCAASGTTGASTSGWKPSGSI